MASLPPGSSSYFSVPDHGLDPHLFEAEHLKGTVRTFIYQTINGFLTKDMKMHQSGLWLHVWLAGSGVTYQWNADRGNGDLDVLIGVDYKKFIQANPRYKGVPEDAIAGWLNTEMREELWPRTAHQDLNGQTYEVTFYWNPGVETDIGVIHPYAAYDVREDKWKVRPPQLTSDPGSAFADEWYEAAGDDLNRATDIYERYWSGGGSPRYAALAQDLLESIHGGRKAAFAEGGKGYGDWANFRWQRAKQSGVVRGLTEVVDHSKGSGHQPDAADIVLTRDILRYQNPRYWQ